MPTLDNKKLGRNLKKAREHAGFSVEEMAEILGISKAYYTRIEAGESVARMPHLLALCFATETDLNTLFIGAVVEMCLDDDLWKNCTQEGSNLIQ